MPSSEVAIGRRMKGEETLIGPGRCFPGRGARPAARATVAAAPAAARRARSQPPWYLRSSGHSPLRRLEPARDHGLVFVLLADRYRLGRDRIVVFHDIDERALGPALHRAGRHHHDLLQSVDQEPHIEELSGPKLKVGIGKL